MKALATPHLPAALAAFVLWALLAAGALYWIWRVRTPPVADAPLAGAKLLQSAHAAGAARPSAAEAQSRESVRRWKGSE